MEEELHISDILPKDWLDKSGKGSIYVSSYHCLTDILKRKQKWYLTGRILNTTFLLIDTTLEYLKCEMFFKELVEFIPQFELISQDKKTEQSSILFLFMQNDLESKTLAELQSARGLLSNIEGKNTNYWHITDYILHFPEGNKTFISPSIKPPDPCPAFLTEIIVDSVSEKISSLELELQSRIKLALRWVDSSEHETNGIDEFLKLWFAIETISMPNSTDIKPLVSRLAKIYQLEPKKANNYLGVGRICGLRSNIVHNGHITGIHQQLIVYLKSIFNDTLLDICGLANNKRALHVLDDSTFDKATWLP